MSAREPRLMVLDDDPFILKIMEVMLKQRHFSDVSYYENAMEALLEFEHTLKPDILFLDINMPDIDGIEVLRLLNQAAFHGNIIFLSGEDELMHKTLIKLASIQGLKVLGSLHKPIDAKMLDKLVKRGRNLFVKQLLSQKAQTNTPIISSDELALAIHNHELVNFYQPQVDLRTGHWVGLECLIRWQHPKHGLLQPGLFIPMAEEYNLITDITRLVIDNLARQFSAWTLDFIPRISINLSMQDLNDVHFSDYLISVIQQLKLSPRQINFEITESRLAQNLTPVLDILARLRLHRFRLSIDDFGTGHSSLLQLRDLPFDELKIDQGFVHEAHQEHRLNAIVKASIALSQLLEMQSVAEGVETREDWHNMQTLGADIAQGFFIGRPMPFADLAAWHRQWQPRLANEKLLPNNQSH